MFVHIGSELWESEGDGLTTREHASSRPLRALYKGRFQSLAASVKFWPDTYVNKFEGYI